MLQRIIQRKWLNTKAGTWYCKKISKQLLNAQIPSVQRCYFNLLKGEKQAFQSFTVDSCVFQLSQGISVEFPPFRLDIITNAVGWMDANHTWPTVKDGGWLRWCRLGIFCPGFHFQFQNSVGNVEFKLISTVSTSIMKNTEYISRTCITMSRVPRVCTPRVIFLGVLSTFPNQSSNFMCLSTSSDPPWQSTP